jgi:hypothetical protein
MPYKSDAQRRFFHAAEARGDIKQSTVNEFDQASKGMKLPEHVKKLYEGGLIDEKEYADFTARYHTSEGEEQKDMQMMPAMGSEDGSKHTEHHDSPMPSKGFDPYLTSMDNDYRDDAEPEEMQEPSREFLDALRKRKRSF